MPSNKGYLPFQYWEMGKDKKMGRQRRKERDKKISEEFVAKKKKRE